MLAVTPRVTHTKLFERVQFGMFLQLLGTSLPVPHQGLCPWTPLGTSVLQTSSKIGSPQVQKPSAAPGVHRPLRFTYLGSDIHSSECSIPEILRCIGLASNIFGRLAIRQHLEADRIEFTDEDTALQCPCHLRTVIWL